MQSKNTGGGKIVTLMPQISPRRAVIRPRNVVNSSTGHIPRQRDFFDKSVTRTRFCGSVGPIIASIAMNPTGRRSAPTSFQTRFQSRSAALPRTSHCLCLGRRDAEPRDKRSGCSPRQALDDEKPQYILVILMSVCKRASRTPITPSILTQFCLRHQHTWESRIWRRLWPRRMALSRAAKSAILQLISRTVSTCLRGLPCPPLSRYP